MSFNSIASGAFDHFWVLLVHRAEAVFSESLAQNTSRVCHLVLYVRLLGFRVVVKLRLFVDEGLELVDLQTVHFEVKVVV